MYQVAVLNPADQSADGGLGRDLNCSQYFAGCAGHSTVCKQCYFETAILQFSEIGRKFVQLGHAIGARSVVRQYGDQILFELTCFEGLGKINLSAIKGALKSADSYVLESAIRLTELLPSNEALNLLPTLADLESRSDIVVQRQLASSLGHLPSVDALALLKKVLTKNIEAPYLREAAISGLAGREKEFRDFLGEGFKDAKFIKYLDHCLTPKTTAASFKPPRNKVHRESYQRGEKFYIANCMACHGNDGNGLEHLGPPLVKSEWVLNSQEKLSAILLQGLIGPITVNGKKYTPAAAMPGLKNAPQITDADLADVSTFIRHAWNNRKSAVDAATILKVRKQFKDRQTAFTPEELDKILP